MTKKEKLLERFLRIPKDFTFDELTTLLLSMGFEIENKGKTSGSRVAFVHVNFNKHILIHKPHPGKIINSVYLKNIIIDLTLKQIL
jgi:predicted RNA binding protein YcfA (HicA-like mRNA interferase family)